ncbi:WCX domain-containing protein [Flavobacterium tiangeerense]|uniref:WYL domain-containing protein n=1 Tax=Flavobacterium tiangeerense TaxID=459471 RepID=UPI00374489A0
MLTKPLHNSQRLIKQNEDGSIIIHLFVIPNYELARIFLGFGNGLEMTRPEYFRNQIKSVIQKSLERYAQNTLQCLSQLKYIKYNKG